MEDIKKYKEIYSLQDEILDLFRKNDLSFYLTGGTCLHRFYYNKRYSDDLDFFSIDPGIFSMECRRFTNILFDNNITYATISDSRDYKRLIVKNRLQLDFVRDTTYHHGDLVSKNGIQMDNIKNMFSNKLTAVVDRDNLKDLFDIYILLTHEKFDTNEIFEVISKQSNLTSDDILLRLKSVPIKSFVEKENIDFINNDILENFVENYHNAIENFEKGLK